MNILQIQDQLKNLSQDQLVREMQMPSGSAPQYLVLSELTRRKKMQTEMAAQQQKGPQQTVAQEAVAAAGVPQAGLPQLAAAMAPKTDITGNTGAMPAQQILPEAPVGMADGGYVQRMQGGSFAGAVFTDPALRVMANRMGMSVQEYLSSVDPAEAERIAQGAEQRASRDRMVGFEPVEPTGRTSLDDLLNAPEDVANSYLDQRYQESLLRPDIFPNEPTAPESGGLAVEPQPMYPLVPGVPNIPDTMDYGTPLSDTLAGRLGGTYLLPDPNGIRASITGAQERAQDARKLAQTEQTMADLRAERGEARPDKLDEWFNQPDEYLNTYDIYSGEPIRMQTLGTTVRKAGNTLYDWMTDPNKGDPLSRITPEERAAFERGDLSAADLNRLQGEREGSDTPAFETQGREQSPTTPEEAAAAAEAARKATEDAAKTATDTPDAPTGGGAGSGGSGGSGGASGLSSYEQEITDAIARSEKRAAQDKWLALAQTGLEIMNAAAKQGTFAGAVGEGGTKGLAAFRQGRDEAEATRLGLLKELEGSRLARAQLAARGGSGGSAKGALTMNQALTQAGSFIEQGQTLVDMGTAANNADMVLRGQEMLNYGNNLMALVFPDGGGGGSVTIPTRPPQ